MALIRRSLALPVLLLVGCAEVPAGVCFSNEPCADAGSVGGGQGGGGGGTTGGGAGGGTGGGCVVGMTVVKNRKGLTVDLEAVQGEVVVLQQTFLLSSEKLERSPDAQVFAHQLQRKLVKDVPVAEPPPVVVEKNRLGAPITETKPEWLEPAPAPVGPKVLGGVSAGVGAVAIGLIIASAVVKGGLESSLQERPFVTTITRAEAQGQADVSNALLGVGIVGLALGLGGGATALGLGLGGSD